MAMLNQVDGLFAIARALMKIAEAINNHSSNSPSRFKPPDASDLSEPAEGPPGPGVGR